MAMSLAVHKASARIMQNFDPTPIHDRNREIPGVVAFWSAHRPPDGGRLAT